MEKYLNTILLSIITALLAIIVYSTGQGTIFGVKQPPHLSCDSFLTQRLFYSEFFDTKDADTEKLALKIHNAFSVNELHDMINKNTMLNATSAEFYASLTAPGSCQAHIQLQKPDNDGTTSIYVPFKISGYVPSGSGSDGTLIEDIQMNPLDITKDKG